MGWEFLDLSDSRVSLVDPKIASPSNTHVTATELMPRKRKGKRKGKRG